jgi:hypothetical protein
VVHSLLSLLFVQKELLRDAPQSELLFPYTWNPRASAQLCAVTLHSTCLLLVSGHREHTKCLSPFDDVVDKTPVIRSVVLKLLLKYR